MHGSGRTAPEAIDDIVDAFDQRVQHPAAEQQRWEGAENHEHEQESGLFHAYFNLSSPMFHETLVAGWIRWRASARPAGSE